MKVFSGKYGCEIDSAPSDGMVDSPVIIMMDSRPFAHDIRMPPRKKEREREPKVM